MQRALILLTTFIILLGTSLSVCHAENIYYKSGKVVKKEITSRTKGTIWVSRGDGVAAGISTKNISRIENSDGSVSKYDYEALEKLLNNAIANSQHAEAARLCGVFLEGSPGYARIRYLRAVLNHKLGNLEETARDYDFLIDHMAADSEVLNNRGIISAEGQNYDEAAGFFLEAINKNPGIAELHNNLANVYMQKNSHAKAVNEYKKVIELEPDNIKAMNNLGAAYYMLGDSKNAQEQWKKVLLIKPDDAQAKKALSMIDVST
jgi:tetratricopeptide (TPR) repeat protein